MPELVGDFLASLRTWMSSSDVDLSAGLSLSKTSLDSLGAPVDMLLEHGVIKECGPTSYKLPAPLVSHLRSYRTCAARGAFDGPRSSPTALDIAELCKHLQSSKAALEPSTLIKGVAPTQRRQIRRLHPVPAGAEGAVAAERTAGAEAEELPAPGPAVDPGLDPEQQQQQQQQQLAARLELLGTALGAGALSPALYEQARRELIGDGQ